MKKTPLIQPKIHITSQEITIGQMYHNDGIDYVILVIGAFWSEKYQSLIGDPFRAVMAKISNPDVYYNLSLSPY